MQTARKVEQVGLVVDREQSFRMLASPLNIGPRDSKPTDWCRHGDGGERRKPSGAKGAAVELKIRCNADRDLRLHHDRLLATAGTLVS